jgi:transcription elongation factor Elf1
MGKKENYCPFCNSYNIDCTKDQNLNDLFCTCKICGYIWNNVTGKEIEMEA